MVLGGSACHRRFTLSPLPRSWYPAAVSVTGKHTWALVLVACAILGGTGCKKKVGAKCSAGAAYCAGTDELFCGADGTLKAMPCHGPKGCKAAGGRVSCDTTNAVAGEGCNYPSDSYECTADKKAVVVCEKEHWVTESTCKGVRGCRSSDDGISCDSSVADPTDDCHTNGNYACTPAKDALLQCVESKFTPLAGCKGPAGCSSIEDAATRTRNFRCDTTLGQEGDTCELAENFTCAVDKKSVLVCRSNKWALHKQCATPCSIDANSSVSCAGVVVGRSGGSEHTASAAAVAKTGGGGTKTDAGAPAAAKVVDAGAAPATTATTASGADAGAKAGAADAGAKPVPGKDAGAPKKKR